MKTPMKNCFCGGHRKCKNRVIVRISLFLSFVFIFVTVVPSAALFKMDGWFV